MRKLNFFLALMIVALSLFLVSCKKEVGCTDPTAINFDPKAEEDCCCAFASDVQQEKHSITIDFEHMANGQTVVLGTNDMPYKNALNQNFKIDELRYLISDVTFHQDNGESFTINDYHYVDLSDPSTLTYQPSMQIPEGNYTSVSFTFGFDQEDNVPGKYPELNGLNWNWNMMGMDLGYHYMQINGVYDSLGTPKGFMTHMGPAMKMDGMTHLVVNNHFEAVLQNADFKLDRDFGFTIVMDVEEWYANPYTWDFNKYNMNVMMDYDAQRWLNVNGPTVFSYKTFLTL